MLRLLNLDAYVQNLLVEKQLSEGHGKLLAGMPRVEQLYFAELGIGRGWSVRQMEEEVKKNKSNHTGQSLKADPDIVRLERIAADRFNSEVKLENNKQNKSGWVKIKYYDYETLSGILQKMGIKLE